MSKITIDFELPDNEDPGAVIMDIDQNLPESVSNFQWEVN